MRSLFTHHICIGRAGVAGQYEDFAARFWRDIRPVVFLDFFSFLRTPLLSCMEACFMHVNQRFAGV